MISRDLTQKPVQETTNEENIDVDMFAQDEKPEAVKSVGDGFQIGDGPVYQSEQEPGVISLDSDGNVKEEGLNNVLSSELSRRVGEVVEDTDDIAVDSEPQVDADTYAKQMEKRHGFSVDEPEESAEQGYSVAAEDFPDTI